LEARNESPLRSTQGRTTYVHIYRGKAFLGGTSHQNTLEACRNVHQTHASSERGKGLSKPSRYEVETLLTALYGLLFRIYTLHRTCPCTQKCTPFEHREGSQYSDSVRSIAEQLVSARTFQGELRTRQEPVSTRATPCMGSDAQHQTQLKHSVHSGQVRGGCHMLLGFKIEVLRKHCVYVKRFCRPSAVK
jgi:hypothetical protein